MGVKSNINPQKFLKASIDNSEYFKAIIPPEAREDLEKAGSVILSSFENKNRWLREIVDRIGTVVVVNKLWNNPLRMFKQRLEFGDSVEEIFVNRMNSFTFNICADEGGDLAAKEMGCYKPDVKAIFHTINWEQVYPVTIANEELRKAFLSWRGLNDLVDKIFAALYSSANQDEFLATKNLFSVAYNNGDLYKIQVPGVGSEATAKQTAAKMRAFATSARFMNSKYNAAGVENFTDAEDLYYFIDADTEAAMSVEVLAYAFNIDKADYPARVIPVDDLGGITGAIAIGVSRDWFKIYEQLNEMQEPLYIRSEMRWNHFLQTRKIFSYSKFETAVVFTTENIGDSAITSLELSRATASFDVGKTGGAAYAVNAIVTATGNASDNVIWELPTNDYVRLITSTDDSKQAVIVCDKANPTGTDVTMNLKCTSVFDPGKTKTCVITVVKKS